MGGSKIHSINFYKIKKADLYYLYWQQKLSIKKMATKLNLSSKEVWKLMKKYGIQRRTLSEARKLRKRIKIDRDMLLYLYNTEKMTLKEIGEYFDCSKDTIRKRMKEYGIPIRTAGESIRLRGSMNGKKNPVYGKKIWKNREHPRGMRGKRPWNKGKRFSKESREKMSKAQKKRFKKEKPWNKGKPLPEKIKQKISKANKGMVPWWKKKGLRQNPYTRKFPTKPEKRFIEICNKYHLPFRYTGDLSFWIENINPDFIATNGQKIAVEIFGRYWHDPKLNPNIKEKRTAEGRKKIFRRNGWKAIIFWSEEIFGTEEEILEKIQNVFS